MKIVEWSSTVWLETLFFSFFIFFSRHHSLWRVIFFCLLRQTTLENYVFPGRMCVCVCVFSWTVCWLQNRMLVFDIILSWKVIWRDWGGKMVDDINILTRVWCMLFFFPTFSSSVHFRVHIFQCFYVLPFRFYYSKETTFDIVAVVFATRAMNISTIEPYFFS